MESLGEAGGQQGAAEVGEADGKMVVEELSVTDSNLSYS